jgi:translation initiation factor 4A
MDPEILQANWATAIGAFEQMPLPDELKHGIYGYGLKVPSEIQSLAVQPIVEGRGVIAQAQSGTGKTGAFSIGVLARIDVRSHATQALLLAPTRELAEQIHFVIKEIGKQFPTLTCDFYIGGTPVGQDQRAASHLPHIVVATPELANDLIKSNHLRCENIHILVLDEADQMLQEGFLDQIKEVFKYLQAPIQVLLFSATMPSSVVSHTDIFMEDPVKIFVQPERITLEGIMQFFVNVQNHSHKLATLIHIYRMIIIQRAIIFTNEKRTVEYLTKALTDENFQVSAIHGRMPRSERNKVMHQFKIGTSQVLIATDIIGRGIDVQQITLVINYELPKKYEQYIHRVGRSGRYGRKGVAISLCGRGEMRMIHQIQEIYHTQIQPMPEGINDIVHEIDKSQQNE